MSWPGVTPVTSDRALASEEWAEYRYDPGGCYVTCRELADFIGDYRDGALEADVRARFERHLTRCPNCVRYLAAYEKAIAVGRRAFATEDADRVPAAASGAPEELIRAILAARPSAPPEPS